MGEKITNLTIDTVRKAERLSQYLTILGFSLLNEVAIDDHVSINEKGEFAIIRPIQDGESFLDVPVFTCTTACDDALKNKFFNILEIINTVK